MLFKYWLLKVKRKGLSGSQQYRERISQPPDNLSPFGTTLLPGGSAYDPSATGIQIHSAEEEGKSLPSAELPLISHQLNNLLPFALKANLFLLWNSNSEFQLLLNPGESCVCGGPLLLGPAMSPSSLPPSRSFLPCIPWPPRIIPQIENWIHTLIKSIPSKLSFSSPWRSLSSLFKEFKILSCFNYINYIY